MTRTFAPIYDQRHHGLIHTYQEIPMTELLSPIAKSNLFTGGIAARRDSRQGLPATPYVMPSDGAAIFSLRLIVEEAFFEMAKALGFKAQIREDSTPHGQPIQFGKEDIEFVRTGPGDMWDTIDAVGDGAYVLVGLLCRMGVPDMPHLLHICSRNNAKFPNGEAIVDEHGKYQKPPGWVPPNHQQVAECVPRMDFYRMAADLIELEKAKQCTG